MRRRILTALLLLTAMTSLGALTATAQASKLLDRNTRYQSLKVNSDHVALVTYFAHGHTIHALLWGAVNALPPNADHPKSQLKFKVNYTGGRGSSLGAGYWRKVSAHNTCGPYTGPPLFGLVKACTMPDGSNWALQVWQRDLRDNGWNPKTSDQSAWELHVSHWSGPLPDIWFKMDWIYAKAPGGPFDHLYGTFTYRGDPVYGFGSNSAGAPTDSFGRLISMDTLNPPWKRGYRQVGGWYRYNTFLVHRPYGDFCAGVYGTIANVRTRTHPGRGTEYRITANGPGVTPVVSWRDYGPGHYVPGLKHLFPTRNMRGPYSAKLDHALNADQRAIDPVPTGPNSCYHTH
jgi:hypothetical protein